jgi:hypothetical protein
VFSDPHRILQVLFVLLVEIVLGQRGLEEGASLRIDGFFTDGAVPLLRVIRPIHAEPDRLHDGQAMVGYPIVPRVRFAIDVPSVVQGLPMVVHASVGKPLTGLLKTTSELLSEELPNTILDLIFGFHVPRERRRR